MDKHQQNSHQMDQTRMNRRRFVTSLAIGAVALAVPAWLRAGQRDMPAPMDDGTGIEPLVLSRDEWQKRLTREQFVILRLEGTEPAGSSPLNKQYDPGVYHCVGCDLDLFTSDTKFDSGTGWPSFWQPIEGHIATKTDYKLVLPRKEYHCARCGGHHGHVFNDGPEPTGLRYCNNGLALRFVPKA